MRDTKRCYKCGRVFPRTKEYFHGDRSHSDGLASMCKECKSGCKLGKYTPPNVDEAPEGMKTCNTCGRVLPLTNVYFERKEHGKWRKDCLECRGGTFRPWLREPVEGMKICRVCAKEKPATIEYFQRNKKNADGLLTTCRECSGEGYVPPVPDGYRRCVQCGEVKPATDEFFRMRNDGRLRSSTCRECSGIRQGRGRNRWNTSDEPRKQEKSERQKQQTRTGYKVCSGCKRELPATLEYFWAQKSHAVDGLKSRCIECMGGQFRPGGKPTKNCQLDLPEDVRRCAICGEVLPKTDENFRSYERTRGGRSWIQWASYCRPCESKKNKENQYAKYDEYAIKRRLWASKHRDELNEYARQRRVLANSNGGKLHGDQWEETKDYFDGCCAYCGKKTDKLTRDHFIPITKGGSWDATNIVPACKSCNSSKNNKDFALWYPSTEYYDEGRERKILYYLNMISGAIKAAL